MIIVYSSLNKSFLIFLLVLEEQFHVREEVHNEIFEQFCLGRPAVVFLKLPQIL